MTENFTNAEDLNERTLAAKKKIEAGGKDALEAHFELNKIKEKAEDLKEEAGQENAEFDKNRAKETKTETTENKENNLEDKTLGPIYMVFRENDNWDKYAPRIIEHIKKELGGKIETKSFLRDTDEKEIKEWYEENEDKFKDKFMLTDKTCEPRIESDKYKEYVSLDFILEDSNNKNIKKIFQEAFGKNGLNELKFNNLENIENSYTKIFKLALEKSTPEKVTFVKSKFGHHSGFLANSKGLQVGSVENDRQVLEFYKKCLLSAGYPESNISIMEEVEPITDLEQIESMKNEWFFIDSHNQMGNKYRLQGLNVINPSEISDTVKPNNDEEISNFIISNINDDFKKVDQIEEVEKVISLYMAEGGEYIIENLIKRIGNEEKLIEVMNKLIDSHKNDVKWREDKFWTIKLMILIAKDIWPAFDQKEEEQIEKRVEEIMNS